MVISLNFAVINRPSSRRPLNEAKAESKDRGCFSDLEEKPEQALSLAVHAINSRAFKLFPMELA
jgi:hypothetical protein